MTARLKHCRAFTLIELLVVLAIVATLLTIVAPRYFNTVDNAKEQALKTNLRILRESIDKYRGDTGHYPETLDTLVTSRYIRAIPVDPITESATSWVLIPSEDKKQPGIYDVGSGATGNARDRSAYASW